MFVSTLEAKKKIGKKSKIFVKKTQILKLTHTKTTHCTTINLPKYQKDIILFKITQT